LSALRRRLEARVLVSSTKDPDKVRAGQMGAHKRWGAQPRTVRLDELTTEQRRLVVALVDAAKSEAAAHLNGTASEVDEASTPPSQSSGSGADARRQS